MTCGPARKDAPLTEGPVGAGPGVVRLAQNGRRVGEFFPPLAGDSQPGRRAVRQMLGLDSRPVVLWLPMSLA